MIKEELRIIKDVFWREPKFISKYYTLKSSKSSTNDDLVFMADGRLAHGGLFDRMKGIITIYAVSLVQRKKFMINFSEPFLLEDYLVPNKYDWRLDQERITYSFPDSRPVIAYGEIVDVRRLLKNRKCQTHYYYGTNLLNVINKKYGKDFEWGVLYRELFKPSDHLQKHLNVYKKEIGSDYYAAHLRFMNLLGDGVETPNNPCLPEEAKSQLIDKCINVLLELQRKHSADGQRMMLASDSMTFLNVIEVKMPEVYIIPGEVKHIDTAGKTKDAENLKVFIDLYMLAGAERVYSIVSEGMWASAFPEYSAVIGGKPFERISI